MNPPKTLAAFSLLDHLVNILKAGFATAPWCGGVASLLSDYIPSQKQRRLESFVTQLAVDLNQIQDKINADAISTDELAFVFEECFRGVASNFRREKLDAYRAILLNALLQPEMPFDECEYFLELLDRLTPLQVRMLSFMWHPKEFLKVHTIAESEVQGGFDQFFPRVLRESSLELIKQSFADLHRSGLTNTDVGIFHTMTIGHGMELLGDRLTPFGKRFIEFCTNPLTS